MTEQQPASEPTHPAPRKISIQDRSVLVGEIVVVNGYQVNRTALKRRFAEGGYVVQETSHFLLFRRQQKPSTLLVHWFAPESSHERIHQIMTDELADLGVGQDAENHHALFEGILDSFETQELRIQERAVPVGDLQIMRSTGLNPRLLTRRLLQSGYQVQETPHFSLFTRSDYPTKILVHHFSLEELNADVKHYLMMELRPLGLIKQSSDYGQLFCGLIGSFFPHEAHQAWHDYGAKTLQRFLLFLSTARTPLVLNFYATIGIFATWYQRTCELCVGESFLDAGCNDGFLPLIIAERQPFMRQIVGIDIQPDLFGIMSTIAQERQLPQVQYMQADLLDEHLPDLGHFDTVVALGVIEHFTEEEMDRVLKHLLAMTSHRLILTVPYEQQPELIYEHKQLFTREKLHTVGQWCLQQLDGHGRIWSEDCDGGLLLVERC